MNRSLKYPFILVIILLFGVISFGLFFNLEGIWRYSSAVLVGVFFLLFLIFVLTSPRLGGLFRNKRELPEEVCYDISFSNDPSNKIDIKYSSNQHESKLMKLREDFRLDDVIEPAKNDYDKVKLIQTWVHSKWEHDDSNRPKKNEADYILRQAEKGECFRCVEYSLVTSECLRSLGFIVRNMGLWTKDVSDVDKDGGHVVNEVYLQSHEKWIFIDPQYDILVEDNGIPLNAVEILFALMEDRKVEVVNMSNEEDSIEYLQWLRPYLYYFTVSLNNGEISILDRLFGSKRQATLLPVNATKPKYFQGLFRINNSIFTHTPSDIYPKFSTLPQQNYLTANSLNNQRNI